jgi:hypothetical protein
MLTAYSMPGAHLLQEFAGRTDLSLMHVCQALADALTGVGESSDVEKALVGFGRLDDGFGFAVDRENDGAAA